jgi:HlyD family secretion protein
MWRILRSRRLLFSVLVVGAILVAALWPEAVEVDVARVGTGPLEVTIDEEGQTRVHERFVISAPVAGRLQRIELEPGDAVERGTVLVRLTPADPSLLDVRTRAELGAAVEAARAAVGQARAVRDRAAATLERARATLRRQQSLEAAGAVARDVLEESETAVRTGEEELRAAEFSLARAEYDLQLARARVQQPGGHGRTIEIRAPIEGLVLRLHRESEAVVPAGEPLLEVGNAGHLEVIADLLSTDAVRVSPGDAVLIEQWGDGRPFQGHVRRVEPSGFMKVSALGVEEQRVNVVIDFDDPAGAGRVLGDAFRVEVRIIVWREADVVKVPVGSLFRRGDDWAVFAVEDGRARLRIVEIGRQNGVEAQILKGVEPAQPVVLHPPDTLADGMRVAERTV